jgi:hypothetical protein
MTDEEKKFMIYDNRRKELTLKAIETRDLKKGEVVIGSWKGESIAIYNEEGIKNLYSRWLEEKRQKELRAKDIKETISKKPIMTPDMELLKKNLTDLGKINEVEKLENELKGITEDLKVQNFDINELKDKVGNSIPL